MDETHYPEAQHLTDGYEMYWLDLPDDDESADGRDSCPVSRTGIKAVRFVSPFMKLLTPDAQQAAFRWVVGHHLLFLIWEAVSETLHRAADAIVIGNNDAAALWLTRACVLSDGDIAAMVYSGDFPLCHYQGLIRPSMERCRPDFSARMSRESRVMDAALQQLEQIFKVAAGALRKDVVQAHTAFRFSRRRWGTVHITVASSLQPDAETLRKLIEFSETRDRPAECPAAHKVRVGDSMLQQWQAKLEQEMGQAINRREYDQAILASREVMTAYDDYFGVTRQRGLTPADRLTSLYRTLSLILPDLSISRLTPAAILDLLAAADTVTSMLREKMTVLPLENAA